MSMATPTCHAIQIALLSIDLDHCRKFFNVWGASDREVLERVKKYSEDRINTHLAGIGLRVP
ncbi:Uncharacterised protein [Mycobacteroides abscessus subsp. massiliense]|nr:Uncharacterised protein [Mycobacteroides abscessus subsp. abscessus]SLC71862.1 Uncharacterised protein [Mycobacteroides abscessus subsp. massiliense]SLJ49541.1 Uncharacterised protein [Mycobacteroides abscessus subsp. abscessus]